MRLIDADSLKERLNNAADVDEFEPYGFIDDVYWEIENSPTIDTVELKHGKWEKAKRHGVVVYSNAYAECSECHSVIFLGWEMKYCPSCGAKMDGEAKDDE